MGVACNEPFYVTAKSVETNTLVLGPESSLYSRSLDAGQVNLIACETIHAPLWLKVKTRYLQREQPALVEQTDPDTVHVEFAASQRAVTPGQAAVFYDGDIVVGGGTIV